LASQRWHMCVEGRVQGVGYRLFVQRKARELGLYGFVQNLPDGRVEVEAEGETSKLQLLRRSMLRGPKRARVRAIELEIKPESGAYFDFLIR